MTPIRLALHSSSLCLTATGGCARVQPHVALPPGHAGRAVVLSHAGGVRRRPHRRRQRRRDPAERRADLSRPAGRPSAPPSARSPTRSTTTRTDRWPATSPRRWPSAAGPASASTSSSTPSARSACPTSTCDLMRVSGCHVVWFRPLSQYVFRRYYNRNHRRILVVDGRVGFTGGAGRQPQMDGQRADRGPLARHRRARARGRSVEYLQAAFAENWLEATGMVLGGEAYFPRPIEPRGQVYAQVARSSPAGGSTAMYTTLLLALSAARALGAGHQPLLRPRRHDAGRRAAHGAAAACAWRCWCPASSTTTSCARPAGPSSATCCGPGWRSTSTRRPCCTPRRWSSTACGRRSAAPTSTISRSRSTTS